MKKFRFIGFLFIFLLTGCGAHYNLVIEDNKVIENLNITFQNLVVQEPSSHNHRRLDEDY